MRQVTRSIVTIKSNKEIEIIELSMCDLTAKQIKTLRSMTLDSPGSMMRKALNNDRYNKNVRVAIAKANNGKYLGWACVKQDLPFSEKEFIMVYVRPLERREGIGAHLIKHFKRVKFCFRWDSISTAFYDKLSLSNVRIPIKLPFPLEL